MTSAPLALAVPKDVERVVDTLIANGFEAFVVGGCVRDAIRGVDPQDWDVATSAKPDEIQSLFERSLYTNRFGTVVVSSGGHEVEVTTYRVEADYAGPPPPGRGGVHPIAPRGPRPPRLHDERDGLASRAWGR